MDDFVDRNRTMGVDQHAVDVRPMRMIVRCYAAQYGDQWQAFSIDFGLAAQADTMMEARQKLENMVSTYVEEALSGPDREYAAQLLARKGPLSITVRYYILSFLSLFRLGRNDSRSNVFTETLPFVPFGGCTV